MKCQTCGTEFDGRFCPGCGAPAATDAAMPGVQTPPPAPSQPVPVVAGPKKPIHKRWWFWAIIVIVAIGVIGNLGGGKDQTGSTTTATTGAAVTTAGQTTKAETAPTTTAGPDLSKVAKEYTLTAGHYTAGIDFPAGKCDVALVSGTGNISSSNMFSGGINAIFGKDDGSGLYTESFKNLALPGDTTVSVSGDLTVKLTFSTIESDFTGRTYDESAAVTLKDGNYEAGTDFAEGVYKIVAVSGSGNLTSSNMFEGGLNEIFGKDDGSGLYNSQFLNAELTKGVTLQISGGLTIKLIPAK